MFTASVIRFVFMNVKTHRKVAVYVAFLHSTTPLTHPPTMCKLQTRPHYESPHKTLQFRPSQHILKRFIERPTQQSGLQLTHNQESAPKGSPNAKMRLC